MVENSQQQAHPSPSQIAAAARGGHGDGQQHGGQSPSAIAAGARSVHGPQAGPDRSPGQIAADSLRGTVNATGTGHVMHSEGQGGGPDGRGWVDWIEQQREKNQQGGSGEDQNQRGKGRSLPEEEKQREKEEERDKGRSLMDSVREGMHQLSEKVDQAREWVHEQEMGCH